MDNESAVLWLNITNFAMAAVVLVCVLMLGGAVLREVVTRLRRHVTSGADSHSFQIPELGMTMADGGERAETPKKTARP